MFKHKKIGILSTIKRKRISTVAGSWVFYLCLALVPLAFLLVSAFSFFNIDAESLLGNYFPNQIKELGQGVFKEATKNSKGLTVFFVITVILSGSALLNQMSKDGDFIYGVKSKRRGVFRRIKAIIGLFCLFLIFFVFALLFAFSNVILNRIKGGAFSYLLTQIIAFLLIILVCYVIIILLNKFISPIKLNLKEVLIGSLVSLLIIVVGTLGFSFYLKYFKASSMVSNGIVSVLAFLTWLYILMLGLTIGCAVIVTINKNDKVANKS